MKKLSVLVPTYNEEDNVVQIANAIVNTITKDLSTYDYELVFIDNDSCDSTRELIRKLCSSNPKIKAIFNAKNYGQFSSPYYGILQATGDCVITMCADFQDPVELIPKYVEEWEKGYKIVLCQKTKSKESKLLYAGRKIYYNFMRKHSNTKFIDNVTGSGLYDRSFVEVMRNVNDPRPFLRGVVAEMGYEIKLIEYEQPQRKAGKSSNGFYTYYDAAAQSLTSYTKTGVRLAMLFGVLFSIASVATTIGCIIYKCFNWDSFDLLGISLQLAIFVAVSFVMLFVGIVGEYVLDINTRVRNRPLVVESERINF